MTPPGPMVPPLADLQSLVALWAPPLVLTSTQSFDLVFDDELPVTVRLHPDGLSIAADLWCGDAQGIDDEGRRILVELLLGLNARAPGDLACWVGLDSRDFILVHGRVARDGLDAAQLASWLQSLVQEAVDVRSAVSLLLP